MSVFPPDQLCSGTRPFGPESLGQGIARLHLAYEAEYRKLGSNARAASLDIVIAGWQRTRRSPRSRPVMWTLESYPSDPTRFRWRRESRHWNFMTDFLIQANPNQSDFTTREGATLLPRLALARGPDDVERLLAETVWRISQRLDVVGSSSLVIRITPFGDPHVRVKFVPVGPNVIGHLAADGNAVHPVTFSPFVVTHSCLMKPAVMGGGGFKVDTGGISVVIEPVPGNPHGFYYPQPRGLSPNALAHWLQQPYKWAGERRHGSC